MNTSFTVTVGKVTKIFDRWEDALAFARKESYFFNTYAKVKDPKGRVTRVDVNKAA